MARKGWSQSDLSRAVFGEIVRADGYKAAKSHASIRTYLNGTGCPRPRTMAKLLDVLGLRREDVEADKFMREAATARRQAATARRYGVMSETSSPGGPPPVTDDVTLQVSTLTGEPDKAVLYIRKIVPTALALKICAMVAEADSAAAVP